MTIFHFYIFEYALILYFLRITTWNAAYKTIRIHNHDQFVSYICLYSNVLLEYHLNCCIHIQALLHFKPYVICFITICQDNTYILTMRRHNRTKEMTLKWLTEAGKWKFEIVNIEQHHFQRQSSLIILLCFTMSQICFHQDIKVNK